MGARTIAQSVAQVYALNQDTRHPQQRTTESDGSGIRHAAIQVADVDSSGWHLLPEKSLMC